MKTKKQYLVAFMIVMACTLVACDKKIAKPIKQEQSHVKKENSIYVYIKDTKLEMVLDDNTSVKALLDLLSQEDIVIHMSDYGNFEKSGDLDTQIVSNDEMITTKIGDVILYQGKTIAIYYEESTYSLTRLGKIINLSEESLQEIVKSDEIEVTFSLH